MSRRGVVILLIVCAGGLFAGRVITAARAGSPGATGALPFSEAVRVGDMLYLASTRFSVYRDRRPPIAAEYAWVELYEKRDGRWWMVGNVSNQAP